MGGKDIEVLYILIGISFSMALLALVSFIWAVKTGQYKDLAIPAEQLLFDDDNDESID